MYQNYLITGATGFLGKRRGFSFFWHTAGRVSCARQGPATRSSILCLKHVAVFYGDLTDKESLRDFFAAGGDDFCVLHCAGLISIASKPDEALYAVNVQGTQNIVDLCREFGASRRLMSAPSMRSRSSRHRKRSRNRTDSRRTQTGDYGKSKAMATALVLEAAQSGLNASVSSRPPASSAPAIWRAEI